MTVNITEIGYKSIKYKFPEISGSKSASVKVDYIKGFNKTFMFYDDFLQTLDINLNITKDQEQRNDKLTFEVQLVNERDKLKSEETYKFNIFLDINFVEISEMGSNGD